MKNRFALNASRSIAWGDKLHNFGTEYGMNPYFRQQRTFFRHLPSTQDMVFAFGKHRGENVLATDDYDYIMWVLSRFRLQPYQRQVLEQKLTLDLRKIVAKISTKPTNPNKNPNKPLMKKLTFVTAVLDVVSDFTAKNRNFSAFDVTQELRRQVNAGELSLYDGSPISFRGQTTTNIPHSGPGGVRELVHQIYLQNDMTDYDRQDTGSYILYTYQGKQQPVNTVSGVSVLSRAIANLGKSAQQAAPAFAAVAAQVAKQPKSRLSDRIDAYVRAKVASGSAPTLKQIQSAVRRQGNFKCDALLNEAKTLGFRIKQVSELSKSTVTL